jgi:hypothetical protein
MGGADAVAHRWRGVFRGRHSKRAYRSEDAMKLDAAARNALPNSAFALPGRHYPIEDPGHAKIAVTDAERVGSPEQIGIIKRKVKEKYGMGESHKDALVKKLQGGA